MQWDYFAAIAARSAVAPAQWRRPLLAWLDGIEKGWGAPLLIFAFAGTWLLFLLVAYQSGSLHPDALEAWSVGREFAWGNAKHPPLMGWAAYLWTLVFPATDWSIQLLAMTNAAVALWAVDLITRHFVRGDKRAVVLLLAMLLPAYQFHAQRFNANTVLLAVWPLATYGFLRAFESRTVGWSIAAGALAALAMLGKYYSIFLIGSFVLAALAHPQRARYFRSISPWISSLAGLVVLGPHIYWLATSGAKPFAYALQAHGGIGLGQALREALFFVLGLLATLALPAMIWVMTAETRLRYFLADFRTLNSGLRLLFWIFVGTIVLPIVTTVTIGTDLPSLWALQGLFLPVILVVCGARFAVERLYTVNMIVFVGIIAVLAVVVAAPIHAIYRNQYGPNERTYLRQAALTLTQRWHDAGGGLLTAISGDDDLAFAAAFYSPDHPVYRRPFQYQYNWGMPRRRTLEKGWAAMCFADDVNCAAWMNQVAAIAPEYQRIEFIVQPRLWGRDGVPATVAALMVLPHDAEPESSTITPLSGDAEDFSASQRQH